MSLVVRWAELEEQSFNRPEKDANKLKKNVTLTRMKLLPMNHPYFLKNVFIMLGVFVETFSTSSK